MRWLTNTLAAAVCSLAGAAAQEGEKPEEVELQPAERAVADVMALSEEDMLALLPRQTACAEAACPECKVYLRNAGKRWNWSIAEPDQLTCPTCETVVPSDAFPLDKERDYLNYLGEKITVPYHEGEKPKGDYRGNPTPQHYLFEGAIDSRKFKWFKGRLPELVAAYSATGKDEYARRIALVLDGLAERYKRSLLVEGRGINNYYLSTGGPCKVDGKLKGKPGKSLPFPWTAGRCETTWIGELQLHWVDAYAAIKGSAALAALSGERGYDVGKKIEDELLREMVKFIMEVPWERHMANNLQGYFGGIARIGRLIDEPEFVHITYRYLSEVIASYGRESTGVGYTFDLHHPEGNQAHFGVMRTIDAVARELEGYSDPPGYKGKGGRIEAFSLERDLPLFAAMVHAPEATAFPDGSLNPLNDSIGWHPPRYRGSGMFGVPPEVNRTRLLPGLGHVAMGAGEGKGATQVQMNFSEQGAGHAHQDCLSITWFGAARELSGDIGYQRNKLRRWSSHALSHNTVVVDRKDQDGGDTFGNIRMFVPDAGGVSAIQVDGKKAYASLGVERYRRSLFHVTLDPSTPYFVDVFEVRGGELHDYAIHGSVLGDMVGESSLAGMSAMKAARPLLEDGEFWIEPGGLNQQFSFKSSPYGLFRNVSRARADAPFHVTLRERDGAAGTRIHFPASEPFEFFLGETPALRPAGHYNDDKVYDWKMPHLIARRGGGQSTFVAVYEPFGGSPAIESVTQTKDAGAVRVSVKVAGRSDELVFYPEVPSFNLTSSLGKRRDAVLASPKWRGGITAATRRYDGAASDSFTVDAELPQGRALEGSWMLVSPPGEDVVHAHEIDRIKGELVVLKRDHGLRVSGGKTQEVFSRFRRFDRAPSFVIHELRSTIGVPVIRPNSGERDRTSMRRFVPFNRSVLARIAAPEGADVRYTLDGTPPGLTSPRYQGPVRVAETAVLKAVVLDPDGLAVRPVAEQRFVQRLVAETREPETQGLRFREALDPKWAVVGNVEAPPLAAPAEIAGEVGGFDLNPSPPELQGVVRRFDGFVRVPEPGLYRFIAQGGSGIFLEIGGERLLNTAGLGPYRPWENAIELEPGAHRLRLDYLYPQGASGGAFLKLEVVTPGGVRGPLPRGWLFR